MLVNVAWSVETVLQIDDKCQEWIFYLLKDFHSVKLLDLHLHHQPSGLMLNICVCPALSRKGTSVNKSMPENLYPGETEEVNVNMIDIEYKDHLRKRRFEELIFGRRGWQTRVQKRIRWEAIDPKMQQERHKWNWISCPNDERNMDQTCSCYRHLTPCCFETIDVPCTLD